MARAAGLTLLAIGVAFVIAFAYAALEPRAFCPPPPPCNGHSACMGSECFPWILVFFLAGIGSIVVGAAVGMIGVIRIHESGETGSGSLQES